MREHCEPADDWNARRDRIIGLGEHSIRKSYYPELRQQLAELERFRALLDQSQDAILLAQLPSWNVVDANIAACRQFGYLRKDLLGLSVKNIIPKEVLARISSELSSRLPSDEQKRTITTAIALPDGLCIPVEMTVRSVAFSDAIYVVIVARDITERKQAEKSIVLRDYAMNCVHESAFLINQDARFEYVNEEACRVLEYTRDELLSMSVMDINPDFPREHWPVYWEDLKSRRTLTLEARHLTKDGRLLPMEVTASYFEYEGQGYNLAMARDITERKRSEDALRAHKEHLEELVAERTTELASAKMAAEAANQAKSGFLANMSHELRTPLNAVLGFSQLMQMDLTLNEKQRENLDIINRNGTHLLGLINDVLEISKIETGKGTLKVTDFDLWGTLESIKEMMCSRAGAKGLQFILNRDAELPRYVRMDERKLKQVIINLAGNAVKFTPTGSVTLRFRFEKDQGRLHCEVEDTGPGICPEDIPKLFGRFVQVGENREGTGLGLYISQKLVELMGGQITVQSVPGKGSLFSFDSRCESVTATETTPTIAHQHVMGLAPGQFFPRILVADDILESRLFLVQILRSTGFEVIEAKNGLEAVKLFEEHQPNLVLMDMKMPVMNGYEAIRKIRSTPQGKTVPILAVTASAFEEDRQRILAIGTNDFISKPVQADELFEKIRIFLDISYIYADEQAQNIKALDQTGLRETIAQLPKDLTDQLAHAITALDLDGFRALLPKVTPFDSPLAEQLNGLANNFQMIELTELFR